MNLQSFTIENKTYNIQIGDHLLDFGVGILWIPQGESSKQLRFPHTHLTLPEEIRASIQQNFVQNIKKVGNKELSIIRYEITQPQERVISEAELRLSLGNQNQ